MMFLFYNTTVNTFNEGNLIIISTFNYRGQRGIPENSTRSHSSISTKLTR